LGDPFSFSGHRTRLAKTIALPLNSLKDRRRF